MNGLYDEIRIAMHAVWHRRWLALAVAWAIAIAGWLVVSQLPNRYEAKARVFVQMSSALPAAIGMTAAAVDEVSSRVSNNARVANENAVKDMTAAGACGKETVYFKDGGLAIRNKECTVKDLK